MFFSCTPVGVMWLIDLAHVTLCSKAGAVYVTRNLMLLSPGHQQYRSATLRLGSTHMPAFSLCTRPPGNRSRHIVQSLEPTPVNMRLPSEQPGGALRRPWISLPTGHPYLGRCLVRRPAEPSEPPCTSPGGS